MVTENINIVVTTRGARVASTQIRGIGRSSRVASLAVRALGVALVGLAGGATVGALFRISDAATEVGNRIRTVTSNTAVFVSVQDRLFAAASRTGASIESTSRLFQRLTVGTRDLGVGTARVINVVEGLNAALVVSGSTAREAEAALLQLGQGLASDNLSGEELRSLRENLPQLAQGLADELDVGIGALKELGRQGQLNAETVFPALERAIARFQEQLSNGDVVFTFAQAFNAVRNEILRFFTIIQQAGSATQDLNRLIFDFADGLAERLVNGLADAIDFVADLIDNFQALSNSIGGFGPRLSAVGDAFSFIGKLGVVAVQGLNVAFIGLLSTVAEANNLLQRFLRFFGLASDFDVELANAQAAGATQDTADAFAALGDTIANFSDASLLELATGVDAIGASATRAGDRVRDAATSLRNAASAPALADDPPAAPPDFFERAAARTDDIRTERGAEEISVPAGLAEGIRQSFGQGFSEAIKNGGDVFQLFADNLQDAANNALIEGFQTAFDTVEGLMAEAFESAGKALEGVLPDAVKGIGPVLTDVIAGAVQFIALQALSALLGGGGNEETSSNGNIASAVTSTQAVRGIVAGPTEIAIANVGQNIEQAFQPVLEETRVQTLVLRGILQAVRGGGTTGGAGAGDTAALAFGSAPAATT